MDDWIWSRPSRIHRHPKPMRRTRRPTASGDAGVAEGNDAWPRSVRRRYCTVRTTLKARAHRTRRARTTKSWWSNAAWKSETISGLRVCSERPMPGMDYLALPFGHRVNPVHIAGDTTAEARAAAVGDRRRGAPPPYGALQPVSLPRALAFGRMDRSPMPAPHEQRRHAGASRARPHPVGRARLAGRPGPRVPRVQALPAGRRGGAHGLRRHPRVVLRSPGGVVRRVRRVRHPSVRRVHRTHPPTRHRVRRALPGRCGPRLAGHRRVDEQGGGRASRWLWSPSASCSRASSRPGRPRPARPCSSPSCCPCRSRHRRRRWARGCWAGSLPPPWRCRPACSCGHPRGTTTCGGGWLRR